jgi:hypothetical protein
MERLLLHKISPLQSPLPDNNRVITQLLAGLNFREYNSCEYTVNSAEADLPVQGLAYSIRAMPGKCARNVINCSIFSPFKGKDIYGIDQFGKCEPRLWRTAAF